MVPCRLLSAILLSELAVGWCAAEPALPGQPVDIGARLEPFVDRFLIDRMEGAELRLHSPREMPLAKSPITGAYMTVIQDGDILRAYYRAYDPRYSGEKHDGNPGEVTCYAESRDGHEWSFPDLGLFPAEVTRVSNAILAGMAPFSHNFSPFLDMRPGVKAEERFKALAGIHTSGLVAFASADGIRWRTMQDAPVITAEAFSFDSQNVSFWSEAEGCYVCFFRTWQTPHGQLRTISRATSPDYIHWSPPRPMHPNLSGEHLYTSQTHPYFRAPHLYLALPTRFAPARGDSTEILFMTSRAGAPYDRSFPEAFIRPGLDPERWGNRANYAALNVVSTGPEEMSIYHAQSGHRYVLRMDGFASVHAPYGGGEMVTRPLRFAGGELVLNVSTSATGSVQVEIQDAAGTAIPGFTLEECPPIVCDRIEHVVAWKGGKDVRALAGRPVRLRFVMRDSDLYALRFR